MSRITRILFWQVILVAVHASTLFAGVDRWTSRGPEAGGYISRVVVAPDDSRVYAASPNGGVYRSEDGGQSWSQINEGLREWSVAALAISPDAPSTLYAGTSAGRIYKSEDAGRQWVEIYDSQAADRQILHLLALPGGAVLAAVTPDTLGHSLLRSTDGGRNWQTALAPSCQPHAALKRSERGTVVWCGTPVSLSEDGGATWRVPDLAPRPWTVAFAPDGLTYAVNAEGIFRSANGRSNWQRVTGHPDLPYYIRDIHVSRAGVLFAVTGSAKAWKYTNRTWRVIDTGVLGNIVTLAAASPTSDRIYAASKSEGVFSGRETDDVWTAGIRGMRNSSFSDVVVSPSEPSLVFASGDGRKFRSDDPAGEWKRLTHAPLGELAIPHGSDVVYTAGSSGVARSTDRGETWTVINPQPATAMAVAPSDPATLYAALRHQGMARSSDAGHTWAGAMGDMPFGYYMYYYGFEAEIEVDPRDPSTVYVAQEAGFFKTTDGGTVWHGYAPAASWSDIAVVPGDPKIVFATSVPFKPQSSSGLGRSLDGGRTWTSVLSGPWVSSVITDPVTPGVVYAGVERGVRRSDDYGNTWTELSTGLNGVTVRKLSIDATGRHLFAATTAGVYEYEIRTIDVTPLPPGETEFAALLERLIQQGPGSASGFILPVIGRARGASGLYQTDVALTNGRAQSQQVLVAWLPHGGGATAFYRLTLPPYRESDPSGFALHNVMRHLGLEGIGTMVAIGIDAAGDFDGAASIGGSARICLHTLDRLTTCQEIESARVGQFRPHDRAFAVGLRLDGEFRTNVGITNLDDVGHVYTVTAIGERDRQSFDVFVPPFSLVQRGVPAGDYGALTLEVVSDDPLVPWLFYGSSTENRTAVSYTVIGAP